MNDPRNRKEISAREAASNLAAFLSDTLDFDPLSAEEVDKEIAASGFDFEVARKELAVRMERCNKQSALKVARVQLNAKQVNPTAPGLVIRAREVIEEEIRAIRTRLQGRGFAYAMRDFSGQPTEDLEAYLEDLKSLEAQNDDHGG